MSSRAIAAYNRRDFEAMQTLNHPDVQLDWSASRGIEAGVYRGWKRSRASTRAISTRSRRSISSRIASSSPVILSSFLTPLRYAGRDGIEAVAQSTLVFEIRGGRLARLCLYQETHEALVAAACRSKTLTPTPDWSRQALQPRKFQPTSANVVSMTPSARPSALRKNSLPSLNVFSSGGGTRTHNLLVNSQPLCRLSYPRMRLRGRQPALT